MTDVEREQALERTLGQLDLSAKARVLGGQDMWSLPALPEIGLRSLVMSDGPIGVRGVHWTADDPSVALPSPTALAATWDPELARRAGRLLAQEARRKGVHLLLAPTINLHRSPLGGRHFEAYSEDPYLTGRIGTGYVLGVQDGGVGATVKHFVANDAETDRLTVDNVVSARALRELYLAPFEMIVKEAHAWAVMAAYNSVNGSSMTEHRYLLHDVLRQEWGFDGCTVSDWLATRDTVRAITGGLDVAMPGPKTVYGEPLTAAVRDGRVEVEAVDAAVRNVLRLAWRVGVLDGIGPATGTTALAGEAVDGAALVREIARRSFVLVRNEGSILPIDGTVVRSVALIGKAAQDARVMGGGSAQVFPDHVVSPLDGLRAALPAHVALSFNVGADPNEELAAAGAGFRLHATVRDAGGAVLATRSLPSGQVQWFPGDMPGGATYDQIDSVEVSGTFTPRQSGEHNFGTRGIGGFTLVVAGQVLFDSDVKPGSDDVFEAFFGAPVERGRVELAAGTPVEVGLIHRVPKMAEMPLEMVGFSLAHGEPRRDPEQMIQEAVASAAAADVAVVIVATTERVESEGFDRHDLCLPGHQDELVARVASANARTVVVVNSGSPVEMPWREDVASILLSWFPGQEVGDALADVLLGSEEPGGRLPTTWGARLTDAPVTRVAPLNGVLVYEEGLFIGYRAWERAGATPAYPFGHGLGYTEWDYEAMNVQGDDVIVRLRNSGSRRGREVVQLYLAPVDDPVERPACWLASFATAEAAPGETAEVQLRLPPRTFEIWDESRRVWTTVPGRYMLSAGHSYADRRLTTEIARSS